MTTLFRDIGRGLKKIGTSIINPKYGAKQLYKGAKSIYKSLPGDVRGALEGTPEVRENVSTLRPEQEPLYQSAVNAGLAPGAGGAFGEAADYYRGNLSNEPEDFDKFAQPALRQYNEDIVPGLSEQFAGMGSGGLSSSGFRNAQVQGATDLSERLAQMRSGLRESAAQGLQRSGQIGLGQYQQNMVTEPGTEGFLSQLAPAVGTATGAYFGGLGGAAAGYQAGNSAKNWWGGNKVGVNSGPYGGQGSPQASPQVGQYQSRLPNRSF